MQEITSINNSFVKEAVKLQQKKYRDKENKFLLEGFKCIEEACNAGVELESVFVLKEKAAQYDFLKDKIVLTTDAVLKKISTTTSAPDAVAIGKKKLYTLDGLKNAQKVVLLENIKDMGNLGTILRTSAAFGVDGVILYGRECADIYNPKCVRASVGNLWKIPVVYISDFDKLNKTFENYERIATLPLSKQYLAIKIRPKSQ